MSDYVWIVEENKKAGFPVDGWVCTGETHSRRSVARDRARHLAQYFGKESKFRVAKYVREET